MNTPAKTGQSRIIDSLNYIHGIGQAELANHLAAVIQKGNAGRIEQELMTGEELSLGWRIIHTDSNTRKRNALRALLLCQRVYFSDLWAEAIYVGGARQRVNLLNANWKQTSIAHWGSRSEQEIKSGILTFALTSNNATVLADAATGPPAANISPLTLTRATTPFPGLTSCYGSIMTWMFKSGLVSYRWFLKNSGANNEQTLRGVFGPATTIWPATKIFSQMHQLPIVPIGHIVHLYVDNPLRWNGHWLVSLGDGYARACNNDDTDGTNRTYTNRCSLDNQFLHGYKHALSRGAAIPFERGIAEVINPLQVPNRL